MCTTAVDRGVCIVMYVGLSVQKQRGHGLKAITISLRPCGGENTSGFE